MVFISQGSVLYPFKESRALYGYIILFRCFFPVAGGVVDELLFLFLLGPSTGLYGPIFIYSVTPLSLVYICVLLS